MNRKLKNYKIQLDGAIEKYKVILKKKVQEKEELLKIQGRLLRNEDPQKNTSVDANPETKESVKSNQLEPYQAKAFNIIQVRRCYIIKSLPFSITKQDL